MFGLHEFRKLANIQMFRGRNLFCPHFRTKTKRFGRIKEQKKKFPQSYSPKNGFTAISFIYRKICFRLTDERNIGMNLQICIGRLHKEMCIFAMAISESKIFSVALFNK
jgi:hypothetical protein